MATPYKYYVQECAVNFFGRLYKFDAGKLKYPLRVVCQKICAI